LRVVSQAMNRNTGPNKCELEWAIRPDKTINAPSQKKKTKKYGSIHIFFFYYS